MPKVKKKKNSNYIKNKSAKKEGIFNFNEQVVENNKKTKTASKKKNTKKVIDNEDHFIGTKELPPINKKKLEKIKRQKIKEKRTKEKELYQIQKRQEELRKKRAKKNKKARLTEKQIKRKKRIKLILKIFILITVLLGIAIYLILSPIFNIKNITVEGNAQISSEQIISLSKIQKDMNLFKVSNKDTINYIKENPYIKKVEIKRILPGTIKINIEERVVSFMLVYGSSYAYIDTQGYILEISANIKEGIPKITGYTTSEEEINPGSRLNDDDLDKLNDVLKIMSEAKKNEINALITTINVEDKNNYSLYLESEQKTVYLGDSSMLDTKMPYVKIILDKEKDHAGEIFVNMDLNEKNPFFREKV